MKKKLRLFIRSNGNKIGYARKGKKDIKKLII